MRKKIILIGSGFGALSAGCRLATHGHEVEIFEKRDKPGGRAYVYEINGFKFDGGPTIITAPFMFDAIFQAAGKQRSDYFELVPVNPFYRIFDTEKRHFDYNNDLEFILNEIEKWNPADKEGYRRLVDSTRTLFEKGFLAMANRPFLKVSDLLRAAPDLIRMQSYQSVYQHVSKYIHDDFLRRVFSFQPLSIGGNPFDSSSLYGMIPYLEREWGVWYAPGGTGVIVESLVRLFEEMGGRIHFNAEVNEILVEGRRVSGVRLADSSVHRADVVISGADAASTYVDLIAERHRRVNKNARFKRTRFSSSLFVIYFGTSRRYTDAGLAHHNVILNERFRDLLDDLFKRRLLAEDFSLFLHVPTLTDPSIAPEGCESFCVMSPVPNLDADLDWTKIARAYRDRIMQFLEENYLPGLRSSIVAEHYIDPIHFKQTLNSYKGAAFSARPILTQTAWFRPHNRSEDFKNLYLVGAGTHPGAGLPGVLTSAMIVENLIQAAD